MTRRTLCMLGTAMTLLAPLPLVAQGRRVACIGMLHHDSRQDPAVNSMIKRLAQLGWVEGRNLGVEYHLVGTNLDGLATGINAMVRLKCDLVVTNNTPVALALKGAAPSMAMVFLIVGDPVALGLVNSLARPGGHATGLTSLAHESGVKMLSLLREVVPAARRVAVMFEAANASTSRIFDATQAAARRVSIVLHAFQLRDWKDVDAAQLTLLRG